MEQGDQNFKGAMKDERIKFFFRNHWVRFLRPVIFGIIVGALVLLSLVFLASVFDQIQSIFLRSFFVIFAMIVSVVFMNLFFMQIINYFFCVVIVTDYRILLFKKTVFLRNDNDAIDLTKIQDIGVEAHGVLRNYLNYGSLIITLSTSAPPVRLQYVPDPHFYLESCNRVKRDYIFRRRERRPVVEPMEAPADRYLQKIR